MLKRRPGQFMEHVIALLKVSIFRQRRSLSTYFEFFVSIFIPFFFLMIIKFYKIDIPEVPSNDFVPGSASDKKLIRFMGTTINSTFIVSPKNNRTEKLINEMFSSYRKKYNFQIKFVNNNNELQKEIYKNYYNGLGIEWANSLDKDCYRNPKINIYYQDFADNFPREDVYRLMRKVFSYKNGVSSLITSNYQSGKFISPSGYSFRNAKAVLGILCTWPCLFCTMHVFQDFADDRKNKIIDLLKIMGLNEESLWISIFISAFIPASIINAIFISMLHGSSLYGDFSFSLLYVCSLYFTIAHILSMIIFLTFVRSPKVYGLIPLIQMMIVFFFSFYSTYVSGNIDSELPRVFLSVIPIYTFQMIFDNLYVGSKHAGTPPTWENMAKNFWIYPFKLFYNLVLGSCMFYVITFTIIRLVISRRNKNRKNNYVTNSEYSNTIKVRNLTKIYRGIDSETKALDDVGFTVDRGEILLVIGPNGAGKSTLVNSVAGIIPVDSGEISIMNGRYTSDLTVVQDFIGLCFQENVFYNDLTVKENIEMFGKIRGVPDEKVQIFIDTICESMNLNKVLNQIAGSVSGGQKRKLSIALSILGDPPLIIMDEPIAGVDSMSRTEIWKTISALTESSVIVTSHALEEGSALASRIMLVTHGEIPFIGSSENLKEKCNVGYLLTLIPHEEENGMNCIVDFITSVIPQALFDGVAFKIPECDEISTLLEKLEDNMKELGIESYSFVDEHLEDVVLRMLDSF